MAFICFCCMCVYKGGSATRQLCTTKFREGCKRMMGFKFLMTACVWKVFIYQLKHQLGVWHSLILFVRRIIASSNQLPPSRYPNRIQLLYFQIKFYSSSLMPTTKPFRSCNYRPPFCLFVVLKRRTCAHLFQRWNMPKGAFAGSAEKQAGSTWST